MAGTGSASVSQRQFIAPPARTEASVNGPCGRVSRLTSDQERAATFWRSAGPLQPQSGHWIEGPIDPQMTLWRRVGVRVRPGGFARRASMSLSMPEAPKLGEWALTGDDEYVCYTSETLFAAI